MKADRKADIEYGDLIVMPGIFDTHNHGGFGVRLDNATQEEIKLYLKGLASVGVDASFCDYLSIGCNAECMHRNEK